VPPPGTATAIAPGTQHALVIQLVTAYLDAEMRDDPAAIEAAGSPGVVFQQ